MRSRCLLLVVVFTLAAFCCCGVTNADGAVMIKSLATDSTHEMPSGGKVHRYLRSSKTTITVSLDDEDRAFGGITDLKSLLQKAPYLDKLKALVKKNPELSKTKVVTAKAPAEFSKRKAALLIIKGQLKPMAIIAAIALTGGYIAYLIKG